MQRLNRKDNDVYFDNLIEFQIALSKTIDLIYNKINRSIGEPSIETLTEAEQQVFYSTLLKRITELKAEDDKRKVEENYAENT